MLYFVLAELEGDATVLAGQPLEQKRDADDDKGFFR